MSVLALILGIEKVVGLIQLGLSSAKAIRDAVESGKLSVKNAGGQEMTAADVVTHVDAAIAKAGEVGDAAAARVEGRPRT